MTVCLSRDDLQAFLAERLSVEEMQSCAAHINECPLCQDAADRLADDSVLRDEYRDCQVEPRADSASPSVESISEALESTTLFSGAPPATQIHHHAGLPDNPGRYQLKRPIARGGFGEVWEAFDPALKRSVAIKMLRHDRRDSAKYHRDFHEEGRKLASLRHPGIVDIYDVVELRDQIHIVTELLEGGTLATRIKQCPLTPREAAALIAKVSRAAHAAHQAGLVHRDIKPSNIVLDSDGEPRLSDFGLAISESEQLLAPAAMAGTVAYMSPEQAGDSQQLLDARSDIYSLGVVLYELLTGSLPHKSGDLTELIHQIQKVEPALPRIKNHTVPAELERICLKCLRKDKAERYQSAAEIANESEAWLNALMQRPGRRRFILSLGAIGASVVGFSLWASTFSRTRGGYPEGFLSVLVKTQPPGARIVVYPIDNQTGLPDGRRRIEAPAVSPVKIGLPPGFYFVVASLDNERFHEVYRTVPSVPAATPKGYPHRMWSKLQDGVEWPGIEIPLHIRTAEMAQFAGNSNFVVGKPGEPQLSLHRRSIPPFLLDTHEVTKAEWMVTFPKRSPASIAATEFSKLPDDIPIAGMWWDDAVKFAEKNGKRLPTEAEYEFAATVGGSRQFPWGDTFDNLTEWPFGPAGSPDFDKVDSSVPVFGLYSNVPEWTASPAVAYPPSSPADDRFVESEAGQYIVRGGPQSVVSGQPLKEQFSAGPRIRISQHERVTGHVVGMRCARSLTPRLLSSNLEQLLIEPREEK